MKRPLLNIDRSWTRLVWWSLRLLRRPIVANDRAHPPTRVARSRR